MHRAVRANEYEECLCGECQRLIDSIINSIWRSDYWNSNSFRVALMPQILSNVYVPSGTLLSRSGPPSKINVIYFDGSPTYRRNIASIFRVEE
jgi:hypothetical protein